MTAVRLATAAATLMLCGLIWVVQLVHYPSFRFVAPEAFPRFHAFHSRRILLPIAVLMPAELVGAALLAWREPGAASLAGFALVAVVWASTAFLQMPAHRRLAEGFDAAVHRRLVRTNWIRTVAWSLRAVLVVVAGWSGAGALL